MTTTIDHNKADVYSRPNARFDGDGQLEIRASAAGNCRRALWYEATGYEVTNPKTEESLTVLEAGNALEPVVLRAMERAGWAVTPADPQDPQQVSVRVGPNMVVTDHPDATGVLPLFGGEAVIEVKTRGPEAFKRWRTLGAERSHPASVAQAGFYTLGTFGEMRDTVIATMDTGSRQWDYEVIPAERVGQALERASEWLGQLGAHLVLNGPDPDALPDRDFSATDWQCKSCPFLNVCLPGDAAEAEGEPEPAGAASLQMISATALDAAQVPIGGDAADLMGNKIDEILASAEEYEPAEALAGGPLTLAGGVAFERHAEGFLSALAALGLELRGNVRSGDAEVRHRHHGTAEALAFEKAAGLDPAPTGWAAFDTKAQEYVKHKWEKHYRYDNGRPYRVSQENFQSWLNAMLASRMRDPVQPWLESLPSWDGQERIPTMFTDALGAEDSDLHRAAATAFMVGAVRRTYDPGCQHDWAPVLIGDQGTGKSTFCCELLPEGHEGWYAVVSSLAQEIQKQVEAVGSALVVEFKEMRGAARYEAVKSYLDTGVDTFRPPYARTSERHKRRWVGIGTGNDEGQGVLPDDPTGNRRYVAIPVKTPGGTQEERATHVREYMKANRTQLWAEALSRHRKGEKSYLGGQYEAMRDTQNTAFTRSNQPMEDIAAVLTEKYADSTTGVSLAELMIEAGLANDVADAQDKVKSAGRKLASQLGKRSWERRRVKQRSLWYRRGG